MADREELELGPPRWVLHEGRPVGVASFSPETEGGLRQALGEAGLELAPDGSADGELELDAECTEEQLRPCQLSVVVGRGETTIVTGLAPVFPSTP